jgi:hypothetical protein
MHIPGYTAEASLYKTNNHYRFAAGGSFLSNGNTTVTPQDCGWVKGITCGVSIPFGIALCTGICVSGGPALCYGCWFGALPGSLFAFCKDCITGWMRDLIDSYESGGSNVIGRGGGGGGGPPPCCPQGTSCKCGGTCVPGRGCVDGVCLGPRQHCP